MAASTDVAFEDLSSEECLEHLEEVPVGRVALSVQALPVILPVNFVVDDGDVVFMTSSGTKLAAATAGTVVAFEADYYDDNGRCGWSVLVQGRAEEIVDAEELGRARRLPLHAWALDGSADHYVRIRTAVISGRIFRPAPPRDEPTEEIRSSESASP